MSVIKVRMGRQGNRGIAGTAAPETIAVNAALSSVVTVANNINAVVTVADNIVDIQTVAASLVAIVRSIPVNVIDFGAIGNGVAHPLSLDFATLVDAQVVYPQATSLTDELDGTALRKAIAYCVTNNRNTIYTPPPITPTGYYRFNTFIDFPYILGARNGFINFIGDIGSADGKAYTPHWVRTVSYAGFRFIGTSLAVTGYNALIAQVNVRDITINGGWDRFDTSADYPVLYAEAGYEFFWNNAVITQALGGVMLREVMDSRFNNIRVTWCGQHNGYNKSMTMTNGSTTATVSSTTGLYRGQRIYGTGLQTVRIASITNGTTLVLSTAANYTGTRTVTFEAKAAITINSTDTGNSTSNNQIWTGFRIENCAGCGLRIHGQNIIDIFLDNCKIENNEYAMDYLLDIDQAAEVFIDKLWLYAAPNNLNKMEYAITTSGKTLATAISASLDTFTIPGAYLATTGNITTGSKIITNIPSTAGLFIGQTVVGAVPFNYLGTYITSIDSSTQVTISDNATTTATGVAITFNIPFDFGVFYFRQFFSGMPVIVYDTTDPRNYMFARVTNYANTTGIVQLHVLNVFGDTSKSITSWKLASCHAGLAHISNAFNCKGEYGGGYPASTAPSNFPYLHSFTHLENVNGYTGEVFMNAGSSMLPKNTFQAMPSTTSITVGTGSKTFTTTTGLPADFFVAKEKVYINGSTTGTIDKQMIGIIESYNSGTGALVVTVTETTGSGTNALWSISYAKQPLHLQTGTNFNLNLLEQTLAYQTPACVKPIIGLNSEFKNTVNAFTKQQYFASKSLIDAASIAWNLDTAQEAFVTLGGNRTLANPTNMQAGAYYDLFVIQDATGSRTLAYDTLYDGGTVGLPTLTITANKKDWLRFYSDGTKMYLVGLRQGFA